MAENVYDAIIVGCGPVGATLANLLGISGLRIAVVEQTTAIYDKPRAISLDHEVMRTFQACGLARDIAPYTAPHTGTLFLGMDGQPIKLFDPMPPPFPLGWPPSICFVQPAVETAIRAGLSRFDTIDVLLGCQAVDLISDESGVVLSVRDGSGPASVLKARYVLGCDGANSFVRKRLGVTYEDLAFDEWWMVVDVLVRGAVDLPNKSLQYCSPERPSSFVVGPGNLRRWEIKLLPGESPEEFGRRDNVKKQVARFVDLDGVEIWRSAVYRFHALLAQSWQAGRIFMLGDAVHQMPPFLAQGLCAGIRDAANLAWKLNLVIRHGASSALLKTYERERTPHVRAVVAMAKAFGKIIGELNPEAARERDVRLSAQLKSGYIEIRQRAIPNLTTGVIGEGAAAGTLFVQPHIKSDRGGVLLDDLLRPRFLLVTSSVEAQMWLTDVSRALWQRIGGERIVIGADAPERTHVTGDIRVMTEMNGLFAAWMKDHSCRAALVRPDRYVYGVADNAAQLNDLIDSLGRHLYC